MTHLRPDGGRCVYYFYFIDEVLGLCFLSVNGGAQQMVVKRGEI